MTHPVQHITQTVRRRPDEVVAFAKEPANLPLWAAGLSTGIRNAGGRWIADSPQGEVEVRFLGGFDHGILDHEVLLPGGGRVYSPLRVIANDDGSEVVFTLFRLPTMTDEAFRDDAELIRGDLARLRDLLEAAD